MSEPITRPDRFIRESERRHLTGLSRTTWWRLEREGKVPKRRALTGRNSVGWNLSEIIEWMAERRQAAPGGGERDDAKDRCDADDDKGKTQSAWPSAGEAERQDVAD